MEEINFEILEMPDTVLLLQEKPVENFENPTVEQLKLNEYN